jgi:transcriptional regulator with XRE-family HTH domain
MLGTQVLNYHHCARAPAHNPIVDKNDSNGFQARLMSLWDAHEKAIARNLPQREVARAVGCSQRTLSSLMRMEGRLPSAKVGHGLATFFGVDYDWLISGKGEATPVESLNPQETELLLVFRALSRSGRGYILSRAQEIFSDEHKTGVNRSPSRPAPDDDHSVDPSNFN